MWTLRSFSALLLLSLPAFSAVTIYGPNGSVTLQDGEYDLVRRVVTDPNEPPVDPLPDLPFSDIAALQSLGLLPEYVNSKTVSADTDIDWSSTAGERGEIGLYPEDHAAYIGGQVDLLPTILSVALDPPPNGVAHSHKPNLYWLPYLMTGNVTYVRNAEAVYKQHRDWHGEAYDSGFSYKCNGRELAWSLRNLAQLAYLQGLGVTQESYYIPAFEATRDRFLWIATQQGRYDTWRVLSFQEIAGWQAISFTGWMESMVGQVLATIVIMGNDDWLPILEWHYEHLRRRVNDWAFKALDHQHIQFYNYPQCSTATDSASLKDCMDSVTRADITPYLPYQMVTYDGYPDDELMPTGTLNNHQPYSLYAYGWASLAAKAGIDTQLAPRIRDAINARSASWGWDNNNSFKSYPDVYVPPVDPPTGDCYDYASLPANEWVRTTSKPVEDITQALADAGFSGNKIIGSVAGSFTAWVGGSIDYDGGKFYLPWGGGHADSALNGIWKLDLCTLQWSIQDMPSDPYAPGYEWSPEYKASNNYSYYIPTWPDGVRDRLPDGKPTSRHTYDGVWFDSKRDKIGQARFRIWQYDVNTGQTTNHPWVARGSGNTIEPTTNHDLFYDEVTDKVYGALKRDNYDYWSFIEYDPSDGMYRNIGTPLGVTGSSYCRYGRTIYGFTSGGSAEQWAEFDMDSKTWMSGNTTGAPTYNYKQQSQVCIYVPEWGKIVRRFTDSPIRSQWYLYDPVTKVAERWYPAGDNPWAKWPGSQAFYWNGMMFFISSSSSGSALQVMRVE